MRRAPSLVPSRFVGLLLLLATPEHGSVFALPSSGPLSVQSTATFTGRVVDQNDAVIAGARVAARNTATGLERITTTDDRGTYQFVALPIGYYRLEINAAGFGSRIVERLAAEVATVVVQNFQLEVGDVAQMVQVPADVAIVELGTTSVGQVSNERTVHEIPLNGRYLIDLGLLVPGSVTPPQNGFLSPPTRGGGSLALNTAGNREDTINFQINGISLNDQVNNILHFNPPLASLGRNVIIGPGFNNVDFSIVKNTKLREGLNLQFRTEVFDVFNHASFGQPGRVVGSATFGRITKHAFSDWRFRILAATTIRFET